MSNRTKYLKKKKHFSSTPIHMRLATIEEKPRFFSFSAHDVRDRSFDSYPVSVHQISTVHSLGRAHLEEIDWYLRAQPLVNFLTFSRHPLRLRAYSIMAGLQVTSCSRHFNKRSEFGKTRLMKKRSECRTSQSTVSSRKLLRSPYFNVKSSDTEKKTLRMRYI